MIQKHYDCDYYICTGEGWSSLNTLDDCPGEGDGGWFSCSDFGYEECMSNPDCNWVITDNMDAGYCDDVNINSSAVLSLDNGQALPGSNVVLPLYLSSNESAGGIQFSIASISVTDEIFIIPQGIGSMNDCFTANFNQVNNQFLGIVFSLEGCVFEPGENHIANIEYYVSPNAPIGSNINLYFSETIVSDSSGNEIPSYGTDAIITLGSVGDSNNDGEINVLDVVMIVNFALFFETPSDLEFWSSDINGDGSINVLDVVLLVDVILGN